MQTYAGPEAEMDSFEKCLMAARSVLHACLSAHSDNKGCFVGETHQLVLGIGSVGSLKCWGLWGWERERAISGQLAFHLLRNGPVSLHVSPTTRLSTELWSEPQPCGPPQGERINDVRLETGNRIEWTRLHLGTVDVFSMLVWLGSNACCMLFCLHKRTWYLNAAPVL
jgi:hypothetical protein